MISLNSLKVFLQLNSYLILLSFLMYYLDVEGVMLNIIKYSIRNLILVKSIDKLLLKKENIGDRKEVIESYRYELILNLLIASSLEYISLVIVKEIYNLKNKCGVYDLILFIPLSFIFEIIFDFFHYWSHRVLHNKLLFKYFHKKHHKFIHPKTITTYYQDPIDLLLTNNIPTILGSIVLINRSIFLYHLVSVYKSFVEIGGHGGKKCSPSSSFTQFIWLPKKLNIELYTEDHDYHHQNGKCNYSKRFSLWDKLFGTYIKKG